MDKLLNVTLAHEFYRCSQAFDNFVFSAARLNKNGAKKQRIDCYNFYVDFLSHLYEFYIGLIDDQIKPKKGTIHKIFNPNNDRETHEIIDNIFCLELEKLFRNRKNRILNGFKDNLSYNQSFYDTEIPEKFGEHFRLVRNRRNHTNYKRASNDFDISLNIFFEKYHTFVVIMYYECKWIWEVDVEKYSWEAIEEFAIEINKKY
jgi:hypothetical protein